MGDADELREVNITIHRQSAWTKEIAPFHDRFIEKMLTIPGPLGFEGAERSSAPQFEIGPDGEPYSVAPYSVKKRQSGVKFIGDYRIPDVYGRTGPEKSAKTYYGHDSLAYQWKLTNKRVDYHFALHENLPMAIEAFEGRFATVSPCYYDQAYQGGYHGDNGPFVDENGYSLAINQAYNRLKADPSVYVDDWNNIYTLYPAQFWDSGRCLRALGYDRDEVIYRLSGKVPLVRRLLDGVYVVLNDNSDINYDEYYAMNLENKARLGLI